MKTKTLLEIVHEKGWDKIKSFSDIKTKEDKKLINKIKLKIEEKMEEDKIYKRVLEIQEQMNKSTLPPEQQASMMNELMTLASQIEQSLNEIEFDINDIETDEK